MVRLREVESNYPPQFLNETNFFFKAIEYLPMKGIAAFCYRRLLAGLIYVVSVSLMKL